MSLSQSRFASRWLMAYLRWSNHRRNGHRESNRRANGVVVEEDQITEMLNAIRILRRRPFLEYNEALAVVARLEATGLRVDPRGLAIIAGALLA